MTNETNGMTSFVLGTEELGNRAMVVLTDAEAYDLDPATIAYKTDATKFPYPTS